MQDKGSNNVINNYKGVMLCSRPNQVNQNRAEKPFCGRVVPPEQIGLVPTKQEKIERQSPKKKNTHLQKHKKWLTDFQKLQRQKKQNDIIQKALQQEKFQKIKQQAQIDRQRSKKMKNQLTQTANNVMQILESDGSANSKPAELNAENLRKLNEKNENEANEQFKKKKNKNEKPLWAMTEKQVENKQQEQVDQLLNFFDNNQVKNYTEDEEVQKILNNLKQKIQAIKQQDNWKEKQVQRMKAKQQENRQQDDNQDKYTNFSVKSEARSVASEKTQQKIQQLRQKLDKKKKGQQQWDKHTTTSKHTATIEDKIAKNLADEVLRNYPNLRGVHSNTSIRKLLQAQASRAINQPIRRPIITTIVKEKIPLDSNNLPYLHRNPAI